MSVTSCGFYILVMLTLLAGFVALCSSLCWHGDQVKAGFQLPGVQLFLSYRRNRRE